MQLRALHRGCGRRGELVGKECAVAVLVGHGDGGCGDGAGGGVVVVAAAGVGVEVHCVGHGEEYLDVDR